MVSDINLLAKRSLETPAQDKRPARWKYTVWSTTCTRTSLGETQPSWSPERSCDRHLRSRAQMGRVRSRTRAQTPWTQRGIAVVARRGSDLTYLRFKDLELPLNQSQIGGERYRDTKPYRTFVYGDRDLYRPDETAHVVAMVRTSQDKPPRRGCRSSF